MNHTIKQTGITIALIIVAIICLSITANAATIDKRVSNKHLIGIPEKPTIITIAVRTNDSYSGTYTDANGNRTFTKHKETVAFSSINDPYLVRQLKTSTGYLQFSSPTKKCNHITCKCAFFIGPEVFSHRHYCSNTKITCKKNFSTYCTGGVFNNRWL